LPFCALFFPGVHREGLLWKPSLLPGSFIQIVTVPGKAPHVTPEMGGEQTAKGFLHLSFSSWSPGSRYIL
jgi:hypothetical protein